MQHFPLSSVMVLACVSALSVSDLRADWTVRDYRGMPGLWKDGQPVTPMIFWQWQPEPYEVEKFSAAGIGLFSFFGSKQHYDHPYWTKDGRVELAFQDAEIRELLSVNPNACFLPRVFATAPEWWIKANPDEAVLSYLRTRGNEKILTVVNLTKVPVKVTVKGAGDMFKPLLSEGSTGGDRGIFELSAYGYFVGKR